MTVRNENHWRIENYKQLMTCKQWAEILLAEEDRIIVGGRMRQLKARNLVAGVVSFVDKR